MDGELLQSYQDFPSQGSGKAEQGQRQKAWLHENDDAVPSEQMVARICATDVCIDDLSWGELGVTS